MELGGRRSWSARVAAGRPVPFIDRTVTLSLHAWSGECADGGAAEFLRELRQMTF
jgi:hypothetical protein